MPPAHSSKRSSAATSSLSESEPPAKTSGGSSSSGDWSWTPAPCHRTKRKSTYAVRKEETEQLGKQVAKLERHVKLLQERERESAPESDTLNATLREMWRTQQLSFALAQSAVSGVSNASQANPLHSYIRLGSDPVERRVTLLMMKHPKIRDAFEYVRARSQFLDPLKPYHSEERFEDASGDHCCMRFDLIQFEGVESVKQVYDALLFFLHNIEISMSERLGNITVREDYDTMEGDEGDSAASLRLLSTESGVKVEAKAVSFAKFFESREPSHGQSCGVLAVDFVDDDALYPYRPQERARRDVSAAIVLTPHMRKKQKNGESEDGREELVVVMAQSKFHRLSHAELELAPHVAQELRDMGWGRVMVKTLNELLHSKGTAVPDT